MSKAFFRRFVLSFAVVAPLFSGIAVAAPTSEEAARFLGGFGERVVTIASNKALDAETRRARLRDLLADHVALAEVGQFALDRYWSKATPEERTQYLDAFGRHLLTTYSRLLGAYDGESFEIVGTEPSENGDVHVTTFVTDKDGAKSRVVWQVRDTDGKVLVFDVIVDGVSMAVTQKAQVSSVARTQGMTALIDVLQRRAAGQ